MSFMKDGSVASFTASFDKETATKWRYKIDDNEHGISGSFYIEKETGKKRNPPESLRLKIRV